MSEYDKLDEFLQEKLKGREYAFKHAYWEAAEELIQADLIARKKRRRFFFFLLFGLIGLGGMIASVLQLSPTPAPVAHSHVYLESICENYAYISHSIIPTNHYINHFSEDKSNQSPVSSISEKKSKKYSSVLVPKSAGVSRGQNPITQEQYMDSKSKSITDSDRNPNDFTDLLDLKTTLSISEKTAGKSLSKKTFSIHKLRNNGFSLFFQPDDSVLYLNSAKGQMLHRRHYLTLSIGRNLSLGFQNDHLERAAFSQHSLFGVQYAYALRPGTRIKTGLYYQGRGGLNADTTFKSINYSFGAETEATTISPQKLHYLEVPLLFDTHIKGRHNLELGANLAFLLNASSKVNRQYIRTFDTEDLGTNRQWGYTQGFNKLDWGIIAGYSYYLNRGFRVGLRARYGLNDITNNQFFLNQSIDRNLQIRLLLEYDLFHF
ncbi:MAG: PorT family protein [Bacteroidetes bacterium]|nr:PorT family protein [Bacteroidota bacterium]